LIPFDKSVFWRKAFNRCYGLRAQQITGEIV
jgi:hypothetical protein